MDVAVISPWNVKCGIFTYTEHLSRALADLGVNVYVVRLPRFGIKNSELLQMVAMKIPVDKVDLIHCQHEYGLYQNLEGGFCANLHALGLPTVFTMHAIGNWEVDATIASVSDRVIVHNKFCAQRFGYEDRTVIIPHGCVRGKMIPNVEAKEKIGSPDTPIVGYLGFISSYKGLETLVEAMVKIPKANLLVAGGWHTGAGTNYAVQLKSKSMRLLAGRCQWSGFIPVEKLPLIYGAMDVMVYPARFATESGAVLTALGYGKAVIASNLQPFREKEKAGALMTFKGVVDLRRKIKRVLKNQKLKSKLEGGAKRYAEEHSWDKIAKQHVKLYESVIKAKAEGKGGE